MLPEAPPNRPEDGVENFYPNLSAAIMELDTLGADLDEISGALTTDERIRHVPYDSAQRLAAAAKQVVQAIAVLRVEFDSAVEASEAFRTPR